MGKIVQKPSRGDVEWSPDFSYAIGLLASDGCVSSDGRHLTLVSKDREQLENLVRCLRLHAAIKSDRIQWSDARLHKFLCSIGISPRKSLTLGAIDIPPKYFFNFLRGLFDGDGSFYSYFDKRWRSSFMFYLSFTSASPAHIEWIRTTLEYRLCVKGHISRVPPRHGKKGCETLRYAKREAVKIMRCMYAGQGPSLSRKRLKIEEALRIVGESLRDNAQVLKLVDIIP